MIGHHEPIGHGYQLERSIFREAWDELPHRLIDGFGGNSELLQVITIEGASCPFDLQRKITNREEQGPFLGSRLKRQFRGELNPEDPIIVNL